MNNQQILKALEELEKSNSEKPSIIDRVLRRSSAPVLNEELIKALREQIEAREQGSIVNGLIGEWSLYDGTYNGVVDKPEITFDYLRKIAHNCEVISAIVEKRVNQVAAFCQLPDVRHGYVRRPGFKIRMRKPEDKATPEDRERMSELEQFIMETGWTPPPYSERPESWQPGFETFIRQITRDTLTLDWVAVRKWKSSKDPEKFPIVAFAAIDAAKVRRVRKPIKNIEHGVINFGKWTEDGRTNAGGEDRTHVKVVRPDNGTMFVESYTDDELFTAVRNARTDESARGYGYSELERALNAAQVWIDSRDYNSSRFKQDALPRGILSVFGQINEQQFNMFRLSWKESMQGKGKRWGIPMLRGMAGTGSQVQYIPFDMSPREMEYHQFMFTVSLWCHALYGIHPDETGLEGLNPNRPPLSQASPQAKLEYSQDSGLTPLLRWIQDLINREIIWKLIPNRRYMFEWVGTGQYDEVQDIQMRLMLLQAGLTTPEEQWAELDQPIPEEWRDNVAVKLPLPIAEGMQYVDQLRQAAMQEQANQQQQQMQATESQQRDKIERAKQMQSAGLPPGAGGMPMQEDAASQSAPSDNQPLPGAQPPQPAPADFAKGLGSRYSAFPENLFKAFDDKPIAIVSKKKKGV